MHDFESILVDGIRAAGAGNRLLARMHVTNAVRQNPAHPACWLWLCATDESIDSAILSLERTLHLDPNHELAKVGLQWYSGLRELVREQRQDLPPPVELSPRLVTEEESQVEQDCIDDPSGPWPWRDNVDPTCVRTGLVESASNEPEQSSSSIVDLTGTVDSRDFQTNMLPESTPVPDSSLEIGLARSESFLEDQYQIDAEQDDNYAEVEHAPGNEPPLEGATPVSIMLAKLGLLRKQSEGSVSMADILLPQDGHEEQACEPPADQLVGESENQSERADNEIEEENIIDRVPTVLSTDNCFIRRPASEPLHSAIKSVDDQEQEAHTTHHDSETHADMHIHDSGMVIESRMVHELPSMEEQVTEEEVEEAYANPDAQLPTGSFDHSHYAEVAENASALTMPGFVVPDAPSSLTTYDSTVSDQAHADEPGEIYETPSLSNNELVGKPDSKLAQLVAQEVVPPAETTQPKTDFPWSAQVENQPEEEVDRPSSVTKQLQSLIGSQDEDLETHLTFAHLPTVTESELGRAFIHAPDTDSQANAVRSVDDPVDQLAQDEVESAVTPPSYAIDLAAKMGVAEYQPVSTDGDSSPQADAQHQDAYPYQEGQVESGQVESYEANLSAEENQQQPAYNDEHHGVGESFAEPMSAHTDEQSHEPAPAERDWQAYAPTMESQQWQQAEPEHESEPEQHAVSAEGEQPVSPRFLFDELSRPNTSPQAVEEPSAEEHHEITRVVPSLMVEETKRLYAQQLSSARPAEPVAGQRKPVVFVVDDSPTVRKVVEITLRGAGFQVVQAEDGVAAVNLLANTQPDLILLDINMPNLNGYKVCRLVKSHQKTRHIPVVLLSGKDGMFDKLRGKMAGCNDYLTKPFNPDVLIDKVTEYVPFEAGSISVSKVSL